MQKAYIGLVIIAAVIIGGAAYLARNNPSPALPSPAPSPASSQSQPSALFLNETPMPASITPLPKTVTAIIQTNKGVIELTLQGEKAPVTVGNFVQLARSGFYNGLIFHRVIPDFMIQGGDPSGNGTGGPGYSFQDEINDLKVVRGALAMANAGPNTNGSQFFIVTGAAFPHLDGKHTVFGTVTAGMDVVDAISHAAADQNDKPLQPVTIESVTIGE